MAGDEELERRVRKLVVEHAETRWLALRVDNDIQDIREMLRRLDARFDSVDAKVGELDAKLMEHDARFDSVDVQLRSLTQLVGQVLDRLPSPARTEYKRQKSIQRWPADQESG